MVIDSLNENAQNPFAFRPPRGFLTSRTALVTGGARRIGRTLALALASEGARVVVHYHNSRHAAEKTASLIRDHGGECHILAVDLADVKQVEGLMLMAAEALGGNVDILVNNAAVFGPGEAVSTEQVAWDHFQAVNLRAPFILAREMARQLPVHQAGDIINLNDACALRPGADHFPYTISKVGLHGLTRSLALSLAPAIRVNELMLGAILSPDHGGQGYEQVAKDDIPTGQFDTPREVGSALLFLLGNPSLTGQSLCIDGGRNLRD